jgi:hypothetical protein
MSPWLHARRNHALEHASVAMLVERQKRRLRIAGFSDPKGFWILSQGSEAEVQHAVRQALARLQAGERYLALSELCGTSILVTAFLTACAVSLASIRHDGGFRRLFNATLAAAIVAPSTGLWAQRTFTVEPNVGDLWIMGIRRFASVRGFTLVRISTAG